MARLHSSVQTVPGYPFSVTLAVDQLSNKRPFPVDFIGTIKTDIIWDTDVFQYLGYNEGRNPWDEFNIEQIANGVSVEMVWHEPYVIPPLNTIEIELATANVLGEHILSIGNATVVNASGTNILNDVHNIQVSVIPEPSMIFLFCAGFLCSKRREN